MEDFEEKDEDSEIDFGKITSFFKKKKKADEPKIEEESKTDDDAEEKEDEEVSVDFGKVKNIFKKKEEKFKPVIEKESKKLSSEEISIDWKKTGKFLKTYGVIFLILIPIILSTYFRMYPAYLPITDDWAKNAVYNHYKSQITAQIDQQYPNLPDANKQPLVENQFQQLLKQQEDMINQQIKEISQQFKSHYQYTGTDGKTHMYLSDIDTYLWYGEVRNYLKHGYFGTDIVDGKDMNMLRNGRFGLEVPAIKLHPYFGVLLYKFVSFFNMDADSMAVFFFISVIIIGASTIPAFFIARKVSGNLGGLFAGIIIAINTSLLGRSSAGTVDTDPWNVFFPLMIMWLFLEAFEAKKPKTQLIYASLSGIFVGLFSYAWGGWWYPFVFILATIVLYIIYQSITHRKIMHRAVKNSVLAGGTFIIASFIFVSLFSSMGDFFSVFRSVISTVTMKEVATITLWPNVLTTVAEFNEIPLSQIIPQMGGKLLLLIAVIGIIATIIRKDMHGKRDVKYAIFLAIWFVGTAYGFTQGVRFSILMVPAVAVAFGIACGFIYKNLSKWAVKEMHIPDYLSKIILIILLCLLLISPLKDAKSLAKNEVILMDDAWYDSLTAIKNNSTDAIITSWWDFGHWFVTIAERRVTFDGADQGRRIYWVGKSLLTDDEDVAIGILKMLNCGQEKPFDVLDNYVKDGVKSINILNIIILQDKKTAEKTLINEGLTKEQANEVLKLTHCDNLIEQYYIASEDMIGKSGVWGHFGSWDFKRAAMYQAVKNKEPMKGIEILKTEFNLSEDEASETFYEIQNNDADRWVSPWPGYAQNAPSGCMEDENVIQCANGIEFNLTTEDATIQTQQGTKNLKSVSFINKKGEFEFKEYKNNTISYSAALIPYNDGHVSILMDPKLAASMFTRLFFFEGHGLTHFKPLVHKQQVTGGNIYVYKVDWDSSEETVVDKFLKKEETPAATTEGVDNESRAG